MSERAAPLDGIVSIKTKLGLLVAVSVLAAVLLSALGAAGGVPTLLTVPVAVALSLGVTQLLASGMTAPLREMTVVAARMARGDYSGRVRTQASDEVGRLAAAFNAMAADLAAADAERRDLVATVSHELRTPLAALSAQLENLADGVVPADAAHLAEPLAQVERLADLVRDLLDLARLEVAGEPLAREPVPLATLVARCAEQVRSAGRDRPLDDRVPPQLVVDAHPARLHQLLVNVLDNAARHSPPGAPVIVTAGTGPRGWWLEVHDAGPGVPVPDRERLFERWGTGSDAGGGTGLGLAVARWVATLHGGSLRFLDPAPGGQRSSGARLRLDVPHALTDDPDPQEAAVPATTPAPDRTPVPEGAPSISEDLAPSTDRGWAGGGPDRHWLRFWPEPPGASGLSVVVASAAVGVVAGSVMTFTWPGGLAWAVVLLLAGAVAHLAARRRREPFTLVCTALAAALVLPLVLRDDMGVAVLCVLAAAAVFLVGATGARTVPQVLLAGVAWPVSSLRGLPWLGRSVRLVGSAGAAPAVVRTLAWSLVGVGVFGALFASADALFAGWIDVVVPSLTFGSLVLRGFVAVAVFGLTLAGAYLALNPPRLDLLGAVRRTPLRNRYEWLAPVLVVDGVFVLFLASQAAAGLGGHDYVESTTGLTYADYVHQGFGQLTVATALTLLVVAVAARYAGSPPADLRWLRASLGLLGVLTLVVVASALQRMHLYQEAYGFTVLRLLVDVFEGWLGLVVAATMVLGGLGRGRHVTRVALVSGAMVLLGLVAVDPDAWVAGRNIDRYEATGSLDLDYLGSLSADAAPVIAERLPEQLARCALRRLPVNQLAEEVREEPLTWNLGRHRAAPVVDRLGLRSPMAPDSPAGIACSRLEAQLDARATGESRAATPWPRR